MGQRALEPAGRRGDNPRPAGPSFVCESLEPRLLLSSYAVTNVNDAGAGSLRQAMVDANANAGLDTIMFNIAGGGIHTIAPTSALPDITDAVVIDATSQPGYAGTPLIELNGTSAGSNRAGLTLESGSGSSTIRGLAINRFGGDGIHITRSSGNLIEHNCIGTDPSGRLAQGNGGDGIEIYFNAANNVIRYNVISANVWGISIGIGSTDDDSNVIQANKIGTDVTGTVALGNTTAGITAGFASANTLIGGPAAGQGNVIAFNGIGIEFRQNADAGHTILGNSIFSNGSLGIDLGSDGVTANDMGDGDTGPNNRQNFPVLTSAQAVSSTQVTIVGSLNSRANSYFRVEFFAGATADGSGYGQGQRYLGFANVATDGSGNAAINATLTAAVAPGEFITATATRTDNTFSAFLDSSEFAQNIVAINHAPVLDTTPNPVLIAVNQDAGAPSGAVGTLVSSLVDFAVPAGQVDNVTDTDSGALLGIAVTAADTSHGTWYYSTDGGATWNALGAVANNNARLLAADANTRLYCQPNGNYHGTLAAAITFRAWDQTAGSNGGRTDTTINGGATAFSTATDTASLTVHPLVHTPSVTDATTEEDTQTTSGLVISRNAADGAEVTRFKITGITNGTLYQNDGTTPIAEGSFITFAEGNAGLKFTPAADFNGSGRFTIQASTSNSDAGLGGGTVVATISVNPVNDAPVLNNQSFSVDENAANGTSVGTVVASDPDAGDGLTYSITAGNTDGAFALDADTGEITVANRAALDYEAHPTFTLTVEVIDSGIPRRTDSATVTIRLHDVSEAPTVVDLSHSSVDENTDTRSGTSVGTLSTADPDSGDTAAYSIIGGADQAHFRIGGADSNELILTDGILDYETKSSYQVTVRVTDASGLSHEETFTVTVNDLNEAPVINNQSFRVDENAVNGTVVGAVVASDVDTGDRLTYSIIAGNADGAFAINGTTGEITVANRAALDYETNPALSVTVRVVDLGGLAAEGTVTINLNGVNEAPIVLVPSYLLAPTAGPVVFRSGGGTGISIRDVDAGEGDIQVEIQITNGDVTLAGTVGLAFVRGDGVNDAILIFTGTLAAVNAALEGMIFEPEPDHVGLATLRLAVDDRGNSGSGGHLLDARVVTILVGAAPPPKGWPEIPVPQEPGGPERELPARDIPEPEISRPDPEDLSDGATEPIVSEAPTEASDFSSATILVHVPQRQSTRRSATVVREPVRKPETRNETRRDDSGTPPVDRDRNTEPATKPEAGVQDHTDVDTASAALAESVHANAAMWSQVASMKGQMDRAAGMQQRQATIVVGMATGVSMSFAAGYVIWLLRGGSLLASLLAATPLWKSFDPLPVLAFWEKRKKQRRPGEKDKSNGNDEHELDKLFGSSDGAAPDESWRVME